MEKIKREENEKEKLDDLYEVLQSDYCNFNLKMLAQKIKSQTYRPKPKLYL